MRFWAYRCAGWSPELWDTLAVRAAVRVRSSLCPDTQRELDALSRGAIVSTSHEWPFWCQDHLGVDVGPELTNLFLNLPEVPQPWYPYRLNDFLYAHRADAPDLRASVERGAHLLKGVYPGWSKHTPHRHPVEVLQLLCEGPYERALTALWGLEKPKVRVMTWAAEMGFTVAYDPRKGNEKGWSTLVRLWKRV